MWIDFTERTLVYIRAFYYFIQNRKHAGRWRFVTFVSMTPAIWANEIDIQKHQEAYTTPKMTLHWSSQVYFYPILTTRLSPETP